ncbi:fused MFS/spermidine synthase [Bradyrhizobium sp. dw_411]|uniref:spermidine synthase n=1 Tax=Bradyrhizobium sp. dw_411 TaxID=2720082 RepID=UPI00201C0BDC|nr:fused MFS/spermidine synthase [Bradyrhizobium sp. dw_411]
MSPVSSTFILAAYTVSIFVSALLLFSVQPLFTKMILPRLGGSPAVWSVAMVFFQSLLLGGYAYAHFLMTIRNRVIPVVIHLALLGIAFLTLPLAIGELWSTPPESGYQLWMLALFAGTVGLPFFALAANNPLLQAWFVRTRHPDGQDPYFLYASSNIGSFLALLSYPLLLEPVFSLRTQNLIWTYGYGLLILLIATCGGLLLAAPAYSFQDRKIVDAATANPGWIDRGRWIFLAAVPSGLLIAVTAHISADIAAAPLLWVLPLSLYLLTWVLVFRTRPLLPHRWMLLLQPAAIAGIILLLVGGGEGNLFILLAGHLVCFFIIAMACHGELARRRPDARNLTGFYLALSFGGMLGGLFAGLIAPFSFNWIAEYPILLVMAALCRPDGKASASSTTRWYWPALITFAAIVVIASYMNGEAIRWLSDIRAPLIVCVATLSMIGAILLRIDRWKFAATIALSLLLIQLLPGYQHVETIRSFFGIHKILVTQDGRYHLLMHGTTVHGAEKILNDDGTPITGRPETIAYYHKEGGIGRAIAAARARKDGPLHAAVIGLGSAALACASQPGESWRFFEIDQAVVDIARDPNRFSFIQKCQPNLQTVIGDARLTFAKEPDGIYDLIVLDAYSSDSIPVHLATREAMNIYKNKLAPHGVIVVHVSNRHLELASVIVGIANANHLKSWVFLNDPNRNAEYIFANQVVIVARDEADVGDIARSNMWTPATPDEHQRIWTDDYSNVVGAVWRRWRGDRS